MGHIAILIQNMRNYVTARSVWMPFMVKRAETINPEPLNHTCRFEKLRKVVLNLPEPLGADSHLIRSRYPHPNPPEFWREEL